MNKYLITIGSKKYEVTLINKKGSTIAFRLNNQDHEVNIEPIISSYESPAPVTGVAKTAGKKKNHAAKTNEILAPMPGIVIKISARAGQTVSAGDVLVVMEAMKMENNISAHKDGKIKAICVKEGQEVSNNQSLILME